MQENELKFQFKIVAENKVEPVSEEKQCGKC